MFSPKGRRASATVAAWIVMSSVVAWACGPYFPNRLLVGGDQAVLWAPVGDFRVEIERILPTLERAYRSDVARSHPASQTADADRTDLESALTAARLPGPQRDRLLSEHNRLREILTQHALTIANWTDAAARADEPPPRLPAVAVPKGLPVEFALYLQGAIAFHQGEMPDARRAWRRVLALAAEQRKFRSTWAAFMLGKSYLEENPEQAVARFEQVRNLAGRGFADTLALAASSLGWQAKAELNRARFERAIELYLQQTATGDATALVSLRFVAARILRGGDEWLRRAARHDAARAVITAYLVADRGSRFGFNGPPREDSTGPWLDAVKAANATDVDGAVRLAWAAYRAGRFDAAERWLARDPRNSAIAYWLGAKLLLRAGRIDQAAGRLALAAKGFPPSGNWDDPEADHYDEVGGLAVYPASRALAELGVLRLARRQYAEALDALVRAGFWMDAAYVAERVLTPDELVRYVDRNWPQGNLESDAGALRAEAPGADDKAARIGSRLRHLLARRLTRLGRHVQAREYYPVELRERFDEYARGLADGRDRDVRQDRRAAALWRAARLARYSGMELLGTELGPDWSSLGGSFELAAASEARTRSDPGRLNRSTADERDRARRHAIDPSRRWHYRYIAVDLAWSAAELMPDHADRTARVLCEAGSWLKARDPLAADRFYKALVTRCGDTALGREADRLRWFPKLAESP